MAVIEWDQAAIGLHAPKPLGELYEAVRGEIDLDDLPTRDPVWITHPSDSSRRADQYRVGRFFLAGDAADLHWLTAIGRVFSPK